MLDRSRVFVVKCQLPKDFAQSFWKTISLLKEQNSCLKVKTWNNHVEYWNPVNHFVKHINYNKAALSELLERRLDFYHKCSPQKVLYSKVLMNYFLSKGKI